MELKIKLDEKMIAETANRVLDEFKYNGKTIREWADLIANPKTNADKIRTMTDEDLAKYLAWLADEQACYGWKLYDDTDRITKCLDFLKKEVE